MTKRRLTLKRISFILLIAFIAAFLIEAVINDSMQGKTIKTEQIGEISSLMDISEIHFETYDDSYYSSAKAFKTVRAENKLVCLDFPDTQIGSVALEFETPLVSDSLVVLNWNRKPIYDYIENKNKEEKTENDFQEDCFSPYKTTRMWADAGSKQFIFSLPQSEYNHLDFYIQENCNLKNVNYSSEPLSVSSRSFCWAEAFIIFAIATALMILIYFLFPSLADCSFKFFKRHWQRLFDSRALILKWFIIIIICGGISALYGFCDYTINELSCPQKMIFCFCLLMIVSILWFNRKNFQKNLDKILLGLILTSGFMIAGTSFNSNTCFDSDVHYRRALKSSYFFSDTAVITQADAFYIDCGEVYHDSDSRIYPVVSYRVSANAKELSEGQKTLNWAYTSGNYYTTDSMHHIMGIAYLPFSFLLFLGRTFKLPFSVMYILAKCGNLLVYAFSMYFACRRLSSRKLLFSVLALLPMHMFMASNYSYDAFLTGLVSLSIVYLFEEFKHPDVTISDKNTIIILLAMGIGISPKPVYLPLLIPLFFLPKTKFRSAKHRKTVFSCTALLILILLVIMAVSMGGAMEGASGAKGSDIHDYSSEGILPVEQVKYVLQHPFNYVIVFFEHLLTSFSIKNLQQIFGDWKTLGLLPFEFCTISILLIIITAFIDVNDNSFKSLVPRQKTVLQSSIAVSVFLSILLICTALYCGNTPVGFKLIFGVQPRYYIPFMFPLTYLITKTGIMRTTKKPVFEIVFITVAVLNTALAVNDMIIKNIIYSPV